MATRSIRSAHWHRVERLRPKLRDNVEIDRHVAHDAVWYVVRDRLSVRSYRFTPAVYFMLARMDGRRTFDQIWREAVEHFGEDAPSQDQILQTASQLYFAHLLRSDAAVDEAELNTRGEQERDFQLAQNLRNPMFLKIPLLDPDAFLNATVHLVRPFCGWLGGLIWLAAMVWLGFEMAMHWGELTADISDRVLAKDSLIAIAVVYPLLKILHEFGHAYANKLAGEEVHEMGVMLLTLIPAPYVDASTSAMIPNKWRRALVAAAGMMVELAAAAVAMWVWLGAEPGFARSLAYDALFTASVSTLIFNGNPLLRFDAYYILSDLVEVPNLASRSQRYYLYLIQRYLFGAPDAQDPVMGGGERVWFALYAPASFAYRMFTLFGIALFVAGKYFAVGVALAVWMLATSVVWPLVKGARFVLTSPALAGVRLRSLAATVTVAAGIGALVAVAPIPNGTVARGIVWIPEDARVIAGAGGNVEAFLAEPGARVKAGDPLVQLADPLIDAKRAKAQAKLAEIDARLYAAEASSPFDAEVLRRQRDAARGELDDLTRQQDDLVVRAPAEGLFVVPNPVDMIGGYVKRGQPLGYVVAASAPKIHAAVPESDVEFVRDRTLSVSVRFDEAPWTRLDAATVNRATPKSTRKLPSPALSVANGGPFALDPSAKEEGTMLAPVFEVEIATSGDLLVDRWGQRVWVRFDHGATPLAERLYRMTRQIFLDRFHV
jgi:putative peptide zinc metalloprotease protein